MRSQSNTDNLHNLIAGVESTRHVLPTENIILPDTKQLQSALAKLECNVLLLKPFTKLMVCCLYKICLYVLVRFPLRFNNLVGKNSAVVCYGGAKKSIFYNSLCIIVLDLPSITFQICFWF